ncbi:NAD(P)-binding domain-containing protein [Phytomonospora endophytica]|uniref:Thioredoxin reductase n=1 Tax=Phytomonospora endophytica TaxID=714109 RepID=A0A841FQL5_9ACTN|nr:NAD(P)-binding domain-containing protein [Phytomonospora endophytica]MBB6035547.1 thioredoxin reductase [Phytomonospora endophytica]GIG70090.1 hypothetical protein Pen01_63850 [Phytomonospora endophytica]
MREVVVIGAGFAGIGMAVALKRAGRHDFVVLERADRLGGAWCADPRGSRPADVPSYSFEPYAEWSRAFAAPPGFADYLRHCADEHDLKAHIRYGAEASSAVYDEPSATWSIATTGGTAYRARAVVAAVGASRNPVTAGRHAFRLDGRDAAAAAIERRIRDVAEALDDSPAPEPRSWSPGGLRARLRRVLWRVGGCADWYLDRHRGRPGH